ncbi:glycosyltransferase [Novosphingobium sp. 9U]|uniref:glycosyltransferase family 2 protein n=1 Tax=Novosphingobium sp. 9U TaxID=2653158 RepID=UPI0012F1D0E7|nr:glycosyltransferase [Novosphingobium sp. 9U]VWX54182.1 Glycosyl transferase family 2 [Novosphingobium sp. 9U]
MHDINELFPTDLPLPAYDVVVPCYNRAHVLADAVASVLSQEHVPSRVVVVDDGSVDASAAVIRALEDAHRGVVIGATLPRNVGASNARNVGLSFCRSPWVAFLDSDDLWLPGAAGALLSATLMAEADVIVGHFCRMEEDGVVQAPECGWDGGDLRAGLASGGVIGPSWSIARRQTALDVGGFDPSYHNCNDWDFYTRLAANGARFRRIEASVAVYRTVAGARLMNDASVGLQNAERVLAHPYFKGA